jgi:hypothetical protein
MHRPMIPVIRRWTFTARSASTKHISRRLIQTHFWHARAKGKEAKLSYNGNLLVENRNSLIVNAELLQANGRAERDAALLMLEQVPGDSRITVGGDKGFDTRRSSSSNAAT